MPAARVYRLPDVGEGLTEAEIVSWKVEPGDTVAVNDVLVEIETAKSLVELPSPYAGTVAELLVGEGQTLPVGTELVRIEPVGDRAGAGTGDRTGDWAGTSEPQSSGPEGGVLVGYGPRERATRRRARRPGGPETSVPETSVPAGAEAIRPPGPVLAKPPVRKLARDLGVDLRDVPATGPGGTVSRADVTAYGDRGAAGRPADAGVSDTGSDAPSEGVGETRVAVRGVRKQMAAAVAVSASTAPHVTEWVTLDASATVDLVAGLKDDPDFSGLKVTPLLVVAKACLLAVRRTPEVNASWDGDAQEIVLKHGVNLGIAVASPRGLLVPNVPRADRLPLPDLCRALGDLTGRAREGTTAPAEMRGTTFTITNVGVFGVDAGTPILNPGESAILAVGAIRRRPWVVDEQVVPRWVLTLALSFDHRVVDGEQGSRFLADVAGIVADPARALRFA